MAIVHGYCTADEVKAQLGDTDGKLSLPLLEKAISATSRAIDKYCGRRFWQDDVLAVRVYRPADSCTVAVDDISTATGLVVKTDQDRDGVFETTWAIGTDFQLEPLNADANGGAYAWTRVAAVGTSRFPCAQYGTYARYGLHRPTVQVTAKFGWSAVPDDVNEAAILKAVSLFRRKDAPFGVAGFGEYGVVRIRHDPDVVDLLDPFKPALVA